MMCIQLGLGILGICNSIMNREYQAKLAFYNQFCAQPLYNESLQHPQWASHYNSLYNVSRRRIFTGPVLVWLLLHRHAKGPGSFMLKFLHCNVTRTLLFDDEGLSDIKFLLSRDHIALLWAIFT